MPNDVTNIIQMSGNQKKINQLMKKVIVEKQGTLIFDFNTFFPMPEILNDTTSPARIVSQKEYDEAVKERNEKIANGTLSDYDTLPMTQEMYDKAVAETGFGDWYSWRCENWGTKWNAYDLNEDNLDSNCIMFCTAWSTPYNAMVKLSETYPDITFEIQYADEDYGYNIGEYTLKAGKEIYRNIPKGGSVSAIRLAFDILGDEDYWFFERFEDMPKEEFLKEIADKNTFTYNILEIAVEDEHIADPDLETKSYEFINEHLLKRAIELEKYEFAGEIKKTLSK